MRRGGGGGGGGGGYPLPGVDKKKKKKKMNCETELQPVDWEVAATAVVADRCAETVVLARPKIYEACGRRAGSTWPSSATGGRWAGETRSRPTVPSPRRRPPQPSRAARRLVGGVDVSGRRS